MICLSDAFPQVQRGGSLSYGGSQLWAYGPVPRKCGCGPVAALDLALTLSREEGVSNAFTEAAGENPIPLSAYNALLERVIRRYVPILPPLGTNGVALALGLDRLFRDLLLPFRCSWGFSGEKTLERVRRMLDEEIPVILGIGQNLPRIWEKEKLPLYIKNRAGGYSPAGAVSAHFVSVTGIDGDWLKISSWGRVYFISFAEFERYRAEHSLNAVCNVLSVARKR